MAVFASSSAGLANKGSREKGGKENNERGRLAKGWEERERFREVKK